LLPEQPVFTPDALHGYVEPFALRRTVPTRNLGKGIGHLFGAICVDGFVNADSFKGQVDEYIRVFRATKRHLARMDL
jgi:LDH2 family malate/lactate/ureidoglycolate dehydrogenase